MNTPQGKRLTVAYEYQLDNRSGQGHRECFSSSCAALARFHGAVSGDDAYNQVRQKYGDTTNPQAQLRALHHLGLKASFITRGDRALIEAELGAGRPLAVGWIHQGHVDGGLRGSGHWSVVSGWNHHGTIHQDPYGEADLIAGGYVNHSGGADVLYSWRNWLRRWEVTHVGARYRHTPGTGWAVLVSKP